MRHLFIDTTPLLPRAQAARAKASRRPSASAGAFARRTPFFFFLLTALVLLAGFGAGPARADDSSKQQMQGLDEQVQEIKSDVLGIAAELGRLEEKLLYPSDTQVSVFVSLEQGDSLRLDSLHVAIDGEPVAHHIYSFKELEALQKGGVQRIYTGNVATGEHRIDVTIAGKHSGGSDFGGSQSFTFVKGVEPRLIGINLTGRDFGDPNIELAGW